MNRYIKLNDMENKDVIVKLCDCKAYEYIYSETSGWNRFGMLDYYNEASVKYDKYEDISPEEAEFLINSQNAELNSIYSILKERIDMDKCQLTNYSYFNEVPNNLEQYIVAIFFFMGFEFYQNNKIILSNLSRIEYSLNILFSYIEFKNESDLAILRSSRNTRAIVLQLLEYEYNNQKISLDKYNILQAYFKQEIVLLNDEQKSILFQ